MRTTVSIKTCQILSFSQAGPPEEDYIAGLQEVQCNAFN